MDSIVLNLEKQLDNKIGLSQSVSNKSDTQKYENPKECEDSHDSEPESLLRSEPESLLGSEPENPLGFKLESPLEPEPESPLEPEILNTENVIESEILIFQNGQAYPSLEAFKCVANHYALTSGFNVIYNKGNNRSNGIRRTQVFICDRYGQFKPKNKNPNKASRNVESKKCGCEWFIRFNYNQDEDKYYVSYAKLSHNHSLIPVQLMRFSSNNREIPVAIKEEILLLKRAGISTSQIQSLLMTKYRPIAKNWVHNFFLLLQQKRRNDPEFSFEFELDQHNWLKHCDYFSMPFGIFTGVTNHGLSYCATGTLLHDETCLSFE
ncbi:5369_t:CDS:2 [Dentiscutata heterogama]|uniref:5369_t:CDS:1 n=1 Tax=Dentiscutata heterogama TaxID=1316150 RepID=A0ACA9LEY4_9GLOM|nr:5369_t:CDS:2 [Dentiscutata heterogama]